MRYLLVTFIAFLHLFTIAQTPELTVQLGHSKLIYDVAYSPDGKFAASASADRTVKIWELNKGREVRTIYIESGYATSVNFSEDSKRLLVGGGSYETGILKLYDLETGDVVQNFKGHKEYAWQADFSTDGQSVFSVSFDGTIRKWSVDSGKEITSTPWRNDIIRGLAIDPKGEYIATTCDASDSMHVVVWKASDLSFVRELKTPEMFEGRTIGWSAKGNYIMVGDYGGEVAIFERGKEQPKFVFKAHFDSVSGLASDHDEKSFFSSSFDNLIIKWGLNSGLKEGVFSGHKDRVYAIDIHPTKNILLSGGSFDKSLKEWDSDDQKMLRSLSGNVYPVKSLLLSDDGNRLFINSFDDYGGDVYVWRLDRLNHMNNVGYTEDIYNYMDIRDRKLLIGGKSGNINIMDYVSEESLGSFNLMERVSSLQFDPTGESLAIGLNDPAPANSYNTTSSIHTYYPASGRIEAFPPGIERLPGNQLIEFSPDGSHYYVIENTWSQSLLRKIKAEDSSVQWAITDTNLLVPGFTVSPDELHAVIASQSQADIHDLTGNTAPWTVEGLPNSEIAFIHFINNDELLISGGSWSDGFVAVVSLSQKKVIKIKNDFTAAQNTVVFDAERNLLISGGDDARIFFFDADTWELQLTLFAFADAKGAWAAVSPNGLFDGSNEAIEQYLYFTYRMEPIELFQLKERYFEPGLIQKTLGYNTEPLRDVNRFDEVSLYPKAGLKVVGEELHIQLMERSGGIGKVSFLINGKEMVENIAPWFEEERSAEGELIKPANTAVISLKNYYKFLQAGEANRLEIITTNAARNLSSPVYSIDYAAPLPVGFSPMVERPTLHALVIGTSDYRGTTLDLNFASKDAEDMANALRIGAANLFGAPYTNIHLLNTDQQDAKLQPTKENVGHLLQEIAKKAKPEDILILYFSGHGVTYGDADAQFYYLTKEIESGDISDPTIRKNFTISTNDIVDWINAVPAQKQIMILDACASGQAVDDLLNLSKNVSSSQIKALDKMKDRTGLFIIAGSAANKVSFEASQYGQSLLTYSLLNNMNLVSFKNNEGMVDLVDWINASKEQVPELAGSIGGIQEPVVALPRNLNSFDIAMIDKNAAIPLAEVKPIFVRSTMLDMDQMDDVLELADRLDSYFLELSTKGRTSKMIFVDVKEFPSAYSVKGLYSTTDGIVNVQAALRKGSEVKGLINVSGPESAPEDLTGQMIREINRLLNE